MEAEQEEEASCASNLCWGWTCAEPLAISEEVVRPQYVAIKLLEGADLQQ